MSEPFDIRTIALFSALQPDDAERMQRAVSQRHYPAGTTLFEAGDPALGFYLIRKGAVKAFKLSPAGNEQIMHVTTAGQTFAEAAVFQGTRYPVSAQCIEECELLFIEREALLAQLQHDPSLALRLLAGMAIKLRHLVSLVEDLTLRDARGRMCRYFLSLMPEGADGPCKVKLPASHVLLSKLLGVTGETFSRTLKQLKTEGIAEPAGRGMLMIHDPSRLRQSAGEPDDGL
jgi:CRP/FNR family transcriptional regulator